MDALADPEAPAVERRRRGRGRPVPFFADRRRLRIGLVNNMPDAALAATERQFRVLVEAAAPERRVEICPFHLAGVPRGLEAASRLSRRSRPVEALQGAALDALVVTGAEPRADHLHDEPFWDAFRRLADWAETASIPTLWSCLAAHAAVLHLSGVERRPLDRKRSGLYACEPAAADALLEGLASPWLTPHSRTNTLEEADLTRAGYRVLSRSAEAGVDVFTRPAEGASVLFLQGHPEYDATSLALEFKRDLQRYLDGVRDTLPELPERAFDEATAARLEALRRAARDDRRPELMARWPGAGDLTLAENTWRAPAARLYRNWLTSAQMVRAQAA